MYTSSILPLAAIFSLAHAHGVILNAQGDAGSPPSVGFQGIEVLFNYPCEGTV